MKQVGLSVTLGLTIKILSISFSDQLSIFVDSFFTEDYLCTRIRKGTGFETSMDCRLSYGSS
jgi:hypothetical protein